MGLRKNVVSRNESFLLPQQLHSACCSLQHRGRILPAKVLQLSVQLGMECRHFERLFKEAFRGRCEELRRTNCAVYIQQCRLARLDGIDECLVFGGQKGQEVLAASSQVRLLIQNGARLLFH